MKRWISPPIQLLLWLGGFACLAAAAWNMWQLRQVTVAQHMARNDVQIAIPDAKALNVPGIGRYHQLVQAPLFWEERAIPRPVIRKPPPPVVTRAPEPVPEVIEILLDPPVGRLVGIVDLGDKRYALVRNENNENKSLYKGDTWEGWKVRKIESGKVVLVAGKKQRAEIPLIGDFEAPKPNKQLLAAKQRRQHRRRQQELRIQRQQLQQQQALQQQAQNNANAAAPATAEQQMNAVKTQLEQALNVGANAGGQNGQPAKPAPMLSIKEALEARQRLMASRWGNKKKQ